MIEIVAAQGRGWPIRMDFPGSLGWDRAARPFAFRRLTLQRPGISYAARVMFWRSEVDFALIVPRGRPDGSVGRPAPTGGRGVGRGRDGSVGRPAPTGGARSAGVGTGRSVGQGLFSKTFYRRPDCLSVCLKVERSVGAVRLDGSCRSAHDDVHATDQRCRRLVRHQGHRAPGDDAGTLESTVVLAASRCGVRSTPTPKMSSKAEKAAMHRRIAAAPRSTETRSPSELASDRPSRAG